MTQKRNLTAEEVRAAYEGVGMEEACKRLGCSYNTLARAMKEHGIQPKVKAWASYRRRSAIPQLNDKVWLHEQTIVKGRTDRELAEELGTTNGNVAHHLHKLGIRHRTQSEATRLSLQQRYPEGRYGPLAPRWKGGRSPTGSGYMRVYKPDHPGAGANGYVYEHRLVMEEKLGRLLKPGEVVDHIDCNRSNNHPDNLRLHASRSDHVKDHFQGRNEATELRNQLTVAMAKLGLLEQALQEIRDIVWTHTRHVPDCNSGGWSVVRDVVDAALPDTDPKMRASSSITCRLGMADHDV